MYQRKLRKKKVIKIIIIVFSVILGVLAVILTLLAAPSAEFDRKIFGKEDFEHHILYKYDSELSSDIFREAEVLNKKTMMVDDYYYEQFSKGYDDFESGTGWTSGCEAFEITKIEGRNIYCSCNVNYSYMENYEVIEEHKYKIEYKGTKILGDIYSWEMLLPNELFPIEKNKVFPFDENNSDYILDVVYTDE